MTHTVSERLARAQAPQTRGAPSTGLKVLLASIAVLMWAGSSAAFSPALQALPRAAPHRAAAPPTIVMSEARRSFLRKAATSALGFGATVFLRDTAPAQAVWLPDTPEVPAFTESAVSPSGMTQREFMRLNGKRKALNHDTQLVEDLTSNIEDQIILANKLAGELCAASDVKADAATVDKLHAAASKFLVGRFQWPSRSTADSGIGISLPTMTVKLTDMYDVLQTTRNPVVHVFETLNEAVLGDSGDISPLLERVVALRGDMAAHMDAAREAAKSGATDESSVALKAARDTVKETVPVLQQLHKRTIDEFRPIFAMKEDVHEKIEANIDYFRKFAPNKPDEDYSYEEEERWRNSVRQERLATRNAVRRLALSLSIID